MSFYAADVIAFTAPLRKRLLAGSAPPSSGDGKTGAAFRQLPAPSSSVVVDAAGLAAAVAAAPPGRHIRLQTGETLHDQTLTINNAGNAPVIILPDNPAVSAADYPIFTGLTDLKGTGGLEFWGCKFDNYGGGSLGGKMIRATNNGAGMADVGFNYCDLRPASIGFEVLGNATSGIRLHRLYCYGQELDSSILKLGGGGHYRDDLGIIVDYCFFDNVRTHRETLSGKCAGIWVYRCHFEACNDLALRQCTAAIVEECRLTGASGNRKIQVAGADHKIINCIAQLIELDSGNYDGTTLNEAAAPSNYRPSANDCEIINCHGLTRTEVGHLPFNDAQYSSQKAKRNLIRNAAGTVTLTGLQDSTTQTGALDPSYPAVDPITLSRAVTGIDAYLTSAGI